MNILSLFRRKPANNTAAVARERLQIILAHERSGRGAPDFLPRLQRELMAVIARYVDIKEDRLNVGVQQSGNRAVLEINVELPEEAGRPKAMQATRIPS